MYGGIHVTDQMKAFLSLPVGLRTFSRMNDIQDEARAEEAATIDRWNTINDNIDDNPEEIKNSRDIYNKDA